MHYSDQQLTSTGYEPGFALYLNNLRRFRHECNAHVVTEDLLRCRH